MNITLGSLVLCKILVLSPVDKDVSRDDGLRTYGNTQAVSSSNITAMKLAQGQNNNQNQQNNQNTQGNNSNNPNYVYVEKAVTGVVEEIKSRRRLVEVDKNKKFEYKDFHTLLVRTNELEKLLVQSESCALAETMISDGSKKTEKTKVEETKPKVVKTPIVKEEKKIEDSNISLDDYEEVLDEETLKLYSKYIDEHKKQYYEGNNNLRIVDTEKETLKNIEENKDSNKIEYSEDDLKRIAQQVLNSNPSKEVVEKTPEIKEELKSVNEQKEVEVVKKPEEALPSKDMALFDFFEEEKRKERIKENKDVEKKEMPKQKKIEVSANYDKKPSLIIEALKIIFFEK